MRRKRSDIAHRTVRVIAGLIMTETFLVVLLFAVLPSVLGQFIPRGCKDETIPSLWRTRGSSDSHLAPPFRMEVLQVQQLSSPCGERYDIELHTEDSGNHSIAFFLVQALSSNVPVGQFIAPSNPQPGWISTECLQPHDSTVYDPAHGLQHHTHLTWVAPCEDKTVTFWYTVLDGVGHVHGPVKGVAIHLTVNQLSTSIITQKTVHPTRVKRDRVSSVYLLFVNRNFIHQLRLSGEGMQTLLSGLKDAIAIDYHYRYNYLFWSDSALGTIMRSQLNGSNAIIVHTGLGTTDGLAVDWVTDKLYWTDANVKTIEVFDIMTGNHSELVSTGSNTIPRALVLDPSTRWMYWTDWGNPAKIEKVSMDGNVSSRAVLHDTDLRWPNALTLDIETQILYWADAYMDRIESSTVDGSNRQLLTTSGVSHPFAITHYGEKLYWTDWTNGIRSVNKDGSQSDSLLTPDSVCGEPFGIQAVSGEKQPEVFNPCASTNGGCSHLCLLSAVDQRNYSCYCPDGLALDDDQLTCSGDSDGVTSLHLGSCTDYNSCCIDGLCQGDPPSCHCDANCHTFGDCCSDVPTDCAAAPKSWLFVANHYFVHQLSFDGMRIRTPGSGLANVIAVDFHYMQNYIFWTDVDKGTISRARPDGSNKVEIVSGLGDPDGLAIDWISNKLYWTDAVSKTIEVYDSVYGYRTRLVTTGENTIPRAIVIDPSTRWMYWTDWGNPAKIEKVSMDGNVSSRAVLHDTDLRWPNALTLDIETQILYWADAYMDRIESSTVDGSNRQLLTTSGVSHPFAITIYKDRVYWTDWSNGIVSVNKTNGQDMISIIGSLCTELNGIQAFAEERQPSVTNPCGDNNGGCSHLCLLSSVDSRGFSCGCPEGLVLEENQQICTFPQNAMITISPHAEFPVSGSCSAAGYTSCCVDGPCQGEPMEAGCFCDVSCELLRDCCDDAIGLCNNKATSSPQPIPSATLMSTPDGIPAVTSHEVTPELTHLETTLTTQQSIPTETPKLTQSMPPMFTPETTMTVTEVKVTFETITPQTTPEPTQEVVSGSCTRAGYSSCCADGGSCLGEPANCFCDATCKIFEDCCDDATVLCPGPPEDIMFLEFREMPQDVYGLVNGTTQFTCTVHTVYIPTIEWMYANDIIADEAGPTNPKFTVSLDIVEQSHSSILSIGRVEYADRGTYVCVAHIRLTRVSLPVHHPITINASAVLTVLVPPSEPSVTGPSAVSELETLQLYCQVRGYPVPTITWLKRASDEVKVILSTPRVTITGGPETPNNPSDLPYATSTLSVLNLTEMDTGEYICEAQNTVLEGSPAVSVASIYITVSAKNECMINIEGTTPCQNGGVCIDLVRNYRCVCPLAYSGTNCTEQVITTSVPPEIPKITSPPSDVTSELLQSVNLTCTAVGYPPPMYQWFKDGVQVPAKLQSYLYIAEVSPQDRGNYTCSVSNEEGQAESPPALLTIHDVFQYTAMIDISSQNTSEIEQAMVRIAGTHLGTSNASVYSLQLLSTNESELTQQAAVLITVVSSAEDKASIILAIQEDFHTYLEAQVEVLRYDGCSAEDTYETVVISNSTEEVMYSWPETEIDNTVVFPCPCHELLSNPDAQVIRHCGGTYSQGGEWEDVDYSQCGSEISSDTSRTLCKATLGGTAVEKSSLVANATAEPKDLGSSDVTVAVDVITSLTEEAAADPEVRDNYLEAIDNIQQADPDILEESQRESQSSSKLLESLEVFVDEVQLLPNETVQTFALESFALQIQNVESGSFEGQVFTANLGSVEEAMNISGLIDRDALVLVSLMEALANTTANLTASISIPETLFDDSLDNDTRGNQTVQRLSYSVFLTDSLFQSPEQEEDPTIGTIIIAMRLRDTVNETLSEPVNITFQTSQEVGNARSSSCVHWEENDGFGTWSSDSCTEVLDSGGRKVCQCNQLAHFGILFDLNPQAPLSEEAAISLAVLTYIGLGLSVVCLMALVVTYLYSKKLRGSTHGRIIINLSISLMGLYIFFLIGGHVTLIPVLCGISAAALHYFMLVFFSWTAAEAVYLYVKLVKVLGTQSFEVHYILKASLITWLVPLLIVGVSAGAGHEYYANPFYCRATEWPFWFGMILPFVIIYTLNWVIFYLIMVSICKHTRKTEDSKRASNDVGGKVKEVKRNLIIAVALATVFGLGWGLGLAATSSSVEELTFAFQVVFTIFVGSQGVLLFLLHGIRSEDARKVWKEWFSKITGNTYKLYSIARPQSTTAHTGKRSTLPTSSSGLSTLGRGGTSTLGRGSSSMSESLAVTSQAESMVDDTSKYDASEACSTSAEKRASGPLDEPVVIVNPAYGEVEFKQPKSQPAGFQQEEILSGLPDTATNNPRPQRRKSWLQSFGKYATYSPVDSTNTPPPPRKPLTESSSDANGTMEEPQQPASQTIHKPFRRERRSLGNIVGQASGYDILQEGNDTPKQMQKKTDTVGSLSLSPSQKEPLQDD